MLLPRHYRRNGKCSYWLGDVEGTGASMAIWQPDGSFSWGSGLFLLPFLSSCFHSQNHGCPSKKEGVGTGLVHIILSPPSFENNAPDALSS